MSFNLKSCVSELIKYIKTEYDTKIPSDEITKIINKFIRTKLEVAPPLVIEKNSKINKYVIEINKIIFVLENKKNKLIIGKLQNSNIVNLTSSDEKLLTTHKLAYQLNEVEHEEREVDEVEIKSEPQVKLRKQAVSKGIIRQVNNLKRFYEKSKKVEEPNELKVKKIKPTKKTKKVKKIRDPNEPKKPINAFLLFSKDKSAKLKTEFPESKHCEIIKMLGEKWKAMSPSKKLKYETQYATNKKEYLKALNKFKGRDEGTDTEGTDNDEQSESDTEQSEDKM